MSAKKKTILHFIYDLGRGGAETMLVRTLKELKDYNNIVVTLYDNNHFNDELECSEYICLKQGSLFFFPLSALRLHKIIKQYKVDMVHTHLFWPTVIARIAVPRKIPLLSTIHAFIATSVEYRKWYIRFIDKCSWRLRKSVIIGVAQGALKEYFSFLKLKPYKSYTLHTFVDTALFKKKNISIVQPESVFRMIHIGALRLQKNQGFLVKVLSELQSENIELHIYGTGPLKSQLQKMIDDTGARVRLMGQIENVEEVLLQYDLMIMSSTYEGFSLSVLEAMAVKVPMLLSDIVSFHEQCEAAAMYFSLENTQDCVSKLKLLHSDGELRLKLSSLAYDRVYAHFTLNHYMEKLRFIYLETLK